MTTQTYQVINVGSAPNDGQGDPLRVAFEEINNNFSSLFNGGSYNLANAVTTGNTSQTIFSWPANNFTQATFQINSTDSGANTQSITINAVLSQNDLTTLQFSGQGTIFIGSPLTTYDMTVDDSGNVNLNVDPFVTGTLYHIIGYQLIPANANISLGLITTQNPTVALGTNNANQVLTT